MGSYVANRVVREMIKNDITVKKAKVLMLGLTFKENCPDLRNTRVVDVVRELEDFGIQVDVHDPWANKKDARAEYGIDLITPNYSDYETIIFAVAHDEFNPAHNSDIAQNIKSAKVLYDLKGVLPKDVGALRL
jgi:UDP-N-acetyl-D-galactosamine dehydrogenase